MPYSIENKSDIDKMKKRLEKTYKSVSDTAARQAIHVWESVFGDSKDEGRAWASVYSQMNERGLSKKADVVFTTYDDPSYEVDVGGVELEFSLPQGSNGSVRIDMGKRGEGGFVVLDGSQFSRLASELKQAITFVESQSRTASQRSNGSPVVDSPSVPSVSRVTSAYLRRR